MSTFLVYIQYVKDTENSEQWLIDEPAAKVVRYIYNLCLSGKGPSQIARQLENEKIMIPSAYYESVGRKHAHKVPLNPYFWDQKTIVHILENCQYTGCAVNFKSTTVSYKVHKKVYKPKAAFSPMNGLLKCFRTTKRSRKG